MHLWKRNLFIWEKHLQIFHVEATIWSVFHSYLLIFHRNLHATKSPFKVRYAFHLFPAELCLFFNEKKLHRSKTDSVELQLDDYFTLNIKGSCFYEKKQKSLRRTLNFIFLLVQGSVQRNNAGRVGFSSIRNICFVQLLKV